MTSRTKIKVTIKGDDASRLLENMSEAISKSMYPASADNQFSDVKLDTENLQIDCESVIGTTRSLRTIQTLFNKMNEALDRESVQQVDGAKGSFSNNNTLHIDYESLS